jgi:penicillin-binding protein 2
MDRMPLKFKDHAWFVAYAPFEDPIIAVVVLVEHGGYGGAAAAPIAKRVIERYLELEQVASSKMASSSMESD